MATISATAQMEAAARIMPATTATITADPPTMTADAAIIIVKTATHWAT